MNCQEFDKHIQAFIDKKIEYAKLDDFIEHYRYCKECHEELEINFLLAYVLGEEDRPVFNLSKELNKHIQDEVTKKEKYYKKRFFRILFFSFTESITLLTVIYFLMILFSWI